MLRLYEQAKEIYARDVNVTINVAACEHQFGLHYQRRAMRAAHDLHRCMANLRLALPRFAEAVRISKANNRKDKADYSLRRVAFIEEEIRRVQILIAAEAEGSAR